LFVGVHAPPIWQAAHAPAWQTLPVPQVVPFGLLSVSVQTGAPVVQTMLPTRQGLPVTSQAIPATHASQLPLRQTLSAPHTVPFDWRSVSSMQTIAFSLQTNIPLWQGLAGTQAPPATQLGASTPPASTIIVDPPLPPMTLPPVPAVPPAPPLPPRPAPAELPLAPPAAASWPFTGSSRKPPHPAASAVAPATTIVILRQCLSSSIPSS